VGVIFFTTITGYIICYMLYNVFGFINYGTSKKITILFPGVIVVYKYKDTIIKNII